MSNKMCIVVLLFLLPMSYSSPLIPKWKVCETGLRCFTRPFYIGCFENGPATKFCHQLELPWAPEHINPTFLLHVPESDEVQTINIFDLNASLASLELSAQRQLWLIVHGFGTGGTDWWMDQMADALKLKGHNVLVCKWPTGAAGPDYFQAVANARVMGALMAQVLQSLNQLRGVQLATTTIVGFSLGAHVAGYAGERLPGLGTIVGLDPAGPLFEQMDPSVRLDAGDAHFVQCIHSNGEKIYRGGFGSMQPMGHVDFYPNGGRLMPGCRSGVEVAFEDIWNANYSAFREAIACSHEWALHFFLHTIREPECHLNSFQCLTEMDWLAGACFKTTRQKCSTFGYQLSPGKCTGMHFFNSRPLEEGFCGKQLFVEMHLVTPVWGEMDIRIGNSSEFVPYLRQNMLVSGWIQTNIAVEEKRIADSVSVYYESYKTWLFELGIATATVDSMRITDDQGQSYRFDGSIEILDNQTVTIPLTTFSVTRHKLQQLK